MESEEGLRQQLEELQKQLGKKLRFEDSVANINSLLKDRFPAASPTLRNQVPLFFLFFLKKFCLMLIICFECFIEKHFVKDLNFKIPSS